MKVIVTKNLNIRVGRPSVNAPCHQFLLPGSELDVDGQLYQGDVFNGVDTWMKDEGGNYYWSGGVESISKTLSLAIESHSTITIPSDLPSLVKFNGEVSLSSHGAGGVVAVLDSGVSNTSFQNRIILEKSFVNNTSDARDAYGHGTKVTGIICGDERTIRSFSSQCSIINYRIADQNGTVTSDAVFFALKELNTITSTIDVINLSCDVPANLIPHIQPIIDSLLQKGVITIVSAGNNNSINAIASLQNVIKVGAVKKENFIEVRRNGLNKIYHCAFIDHPIRSTVANNKPPEISQVSAYTAVVSSIICSFLKEDLNQAIQAQQRIAAVVNFIATSAFTFSQQESPEIFKLLKP